LGEQQAREQQPDNDQEEGRHHLALLPAARWARGHLELKMAWIFAWMSLAMAWPGLVATIAAMMIATITTIPMYSAAVWPRSSRIRRRSDSTARTPSTWKVHMSCSIC